VALRWVLAIALSGCFIKPDPPGISREAGVGDDAPSTGDSNDGTLSKQANVVFITSGVFLPNDPSSSLTRADQLCAQTAHLATPPIPGNFVAWLSGNGVGESAIERLRARNPRGWRLVNGDPFADTVDDIAAINIFTTPHIDENGVDVLTLGGAVQAATGSDRHGNDMVGADTQCSQGRIEIGRPIVADFSWSEAGYLLCSDTTMRLYCFQVDLQVHVP
jgi:hypothetical protein